MSRAFREISEALILALIVFLVIQGSHDSLIWADEARDFAQTLREKSQRPVHYLEFPGGQHAFDMFHSVRSAYAVRAAAAFLESVRHRTHS